MPDNSMLYHQYEDKMQRTGLFQVISEHYAPNRALYPGSFIHISPSFFIPYVVYIDNDKKAKKFFADISYMEIIRTKKNYSGSFEAIFYGQDYQISIPEREESFDLLISQYAGFVSRSTAKYLKPSGILLANNSHGDAGVIALDPNFSLIGVVNYHNKKFIYSNKNLEDYFIPKKYIQEVTIDYLLSRTKGIAYKKSVSHYVFQKKERI